MKQRDTKTNDVIIYFEAKRQAMTLYAAVRMLADGFTGVLKKYSAARD